MSGTSIFSALQPSPPWFPYSTSIVCLVKGQLCVLCQAPDIQCSSAVATLVPLLNQHCLPCLRVSFVYCVRHLNIQCSSAVATLVPLLNQHCLPCLSQLCVLCQAPRYSVLFSRRHLGSLTQPALSALFKGQLCVLCQAPRYSVLFSRRHLGSLTQPALSAL